MLNDSEYDMDEIPNDIIVDLVQKITAKLNLKRMNEDDFNILSRIITHQEYEEVSKWFNFSDSDLEVIQTIIAS